VLLKEYHCWDGWGDFYPVVEKVSVEYPVTQREAHSQCPLCGDRKPENFKIYFDGYVKLYKCKTCAFVAQYPGPGQYTVFNSYEDFPKSRTLEKGQEFLYPHKRRALQNIVDHVLDIVEPGKILDVGCGDGHFLHLCALRGFTCYGIEPSKKTSAYASSRTGIHVIQGTYGKELFPENSFNVISFIHVLEHIPNPASVLEAARYHLRSGGILVVEVPSIHSPHFLLYQLTGIKWFVRPPKGIIYSHINYFSPKTLVALIEQTGFKQKELITGRWKFKYDGILGSIASITDPLMSAAKVGGILYLGVNE
jgi:2-polyprenyl-3-methyl-5-hydroxy-6-metoxy-1,4-benzoquinol methylase